MTTPIDGVEGTQGKLFYWTRQGLSLADFEQAVEAAIARVQEAGGISGITQIGIDLVTATTQLEARQVIDAASTADIGSGGGGGGTAINLPINISDVIDLATQLGDRSLVGHHHTTSDLDGLSTEVRNLLNAADAAAISAALGLPALVSSQLTAVNAAIAALTVRVTALETMNIASVPWLLGTTAGVYPPRPATTRAVWFIDPNVQPAINGLVTGGGGMVPDGTLPNGLMDFWVS